VAYELTGTPNARILWATGRANFQRTGSFLYGTLQGAAKRVQPILAGPGSVLTYTITLNNPGPDLTGARLTDTLPVEVDYLGNLWASSGSYGESGGVITWAGSVSGGVPVTITFGVSVKSHVTAPQAIQNTAFVDDGQCNLWQRQATVIANGLPAYLPIVTK
jgi:uncharacterized repeat protein (TIGR01451 family)